MARANVSRLVKLAYEAGDPAAALALLERSIALLRYLQAQRVDAPLDARHHAYVRAVAARMSAETLRRVAAEARSRARVDERRGAGGGDARVDTAE
jgi:hypothetical protein